MTAWGFADCQRDPDGPGNGSMLGRLFLRTLPGEYTSESAYTWFPLMTPEMMRRVFANLGGSWVGAYDLRRPTTVPAVQELVAYEDVRRVLTDESAFGTGFSGRVKSLVRGPG